MSNLNERVIVEVIDDPKPEYTEYMDSFILGMGAGDYRGPTRSDKGYWSLKQNKAFDKAMARVRKEFPTVQHEYGPIVSEWPEDARRAFEEAYSLPQVAWVPKDLTGDFRAVQSVLQDLGLAWTLISDLKPYDPFLAVVGDSEARGVTPEEALLKALLLERGRS